MVTLYPAQATSVALLLAALASDFWVLTDARTRAKQGRPAQAQHTGGLVPGMRGPVAHFPAALPDGNRPQPLHPPATLTPTTASNRTVGVWGLGPQVNMRNDEARAFRGQGTVRVERATRIELA
jgi:hypothetical protein